jgi:hypothetical protein
LNDETRKKNYHFKIFFKVKKNSNKKNGDQIW